MTTDEMLRQFCDPDDYRKAVPLQNPFTYDGHTYASDGRILVRVPEAAGYGSCDFGKSAKELFDFAIPDGPWVDLETVTLPELVDCDRCSSEKPVCKECDGTGEVEWATDRHFYTAECKECHGGCVGVCRFCKDKSREDPSVRISDVAFSSRLVRDIQRLPGTKRLLTRGTKGAYFTFEGGEGILMPRRD